MRSLLRVCMGLIIWAIGFALLYAAHGVGCALEWHRIPLLGGSVFRWMLCLLWLLLCMSIAVLLWQNLRLPKSSEQRLTVILTLAGGATLIITGFPVAVTSACL